ncbi:MAG: hypothetical protein PF638_11615 [Candidatus Delongbacteria bacterium]|nr:hypothetical protein [Candidatus Delongbacteria bacterium]
MKLNILLTPIICSYSLIKSTVIGNSNSNSNNHTINQKGEQNEKDQ